MSVKTVFIKRHSHTAGKWIYQGYQNAWEKLNYTVRFYDDLGEINNFNEKYYLMAVDGSVTDEARINVLRKSEKTFLFVQPNQFPSPWGQHPNFQCHCPDTIIKQLNEIENVFYWNFAGTPTVPHLNYNKWQKDIRMVSLAYDSLAYDSMGYSHLKDNKYAYDICYVGGRADNGFDEKYKIMLQYFGQFRNSKRKIGIFINKNLTHEQENLILCSSKVCLNIHDNYQRQLNTCDTNERTFKSLGCNGIMVSDKEGYIPERFPDLPICESPAQMVELSEHYLNMDPKEIEDIKKKYQEWILKEHTYVHRVKTMLSFESPD